MVFVLRVKERTDVGGQDVKADVLKFNFEESPKRVTKDLALFDFVVFADMRNKQIQILSATDIKQRLQYTISNDVKWYAEDFKRRIERPELKPAAKMDEVLPRRRKRGLRF